MRRRAEPARGRTWPALRPAVHLALFGFSLYAVDRVLGEYEPGALAAALQRIPLWIVALALLATALGYLSLIGHDWVAFRILGRPMPFRVVAIPSFVSFAVSASAPGSMITGGGVRYRMYRTKGIDATEAAALALTDGVTWLIGLLVLAGATFAVGGATTMPARGMAGTAGRPLGLACLVAAGAYFALAARRPAPLRLFGFVVRVPPPRLALAQLAVSVADWLFSSGALYALIRSVTAVPYMRFLPLFFAAQVGSLLLPVPGGLGVFEALVLLLAPQAADRPSILAALLLYRAIYYLLPLLLAGLLVFRLVAEGTSPTERLHRGTRPRTTRARGAHLRLGSAALPDRRDPARRAPVCVARAPPSRPLIDAIGFLASIVGTGLLIVAWGLERRSRSAYRITVVLFGWGILLALTRSADVRLSMGMLVVVGVMLLARRAFTGEGGTPEPSRPIGSGWAFAAGAALLVSLWLGLWTQRWGEARGETWWRFTLFGGAPAVVRAAAGAAVALGAAALVRVMAGAVRRPPRSSGWKPAP